MIDKKRFSQPAFAVKIIDDDSIDEKIAKGQKKFYCIQENRTGDREVVIVTNTMRNGIEVEHSVGTVSINDPGLPDWIRNPALLFDCYHENGQVVKP